MARKTFNVLFFIKKARLLKNGEAPVCMRITVNGCMVDVLVKMKLSCKSMESGKRKLQRKRSYVGGTEPLLGNHTLSHSPNL